VKDTNYIDIVPDDRVFQLSNYAFDGSVFDIYGALLNGAGLVLVRKDDILDMERLTRVIRLETVNVFFITAALFNMVADYRLECLRYVRKLIVGGDKVSVDHAEKALEFLGPGRLLNGYGPTETTVFAAVHAIDDVDLRSGSVPIGAPISNTTLYVLDPAMRPVPIGVTGEIYIGGAGVARGYLKRPQLTAEKFLDSPFIDGDRLYRTGDLGCWLPEGTIRFLGRKDFQVKIRGFRIECGEIENRLLQLEEIDEAIVLAWEDRAGERSLCAYITGAGGENLDVNSVKTRLAGQLPVYMIPSYFVPLEKFPLNANGKVDRKRLPLPGTDQRRVDTPFTPAQNHMEKTISHVWKDVLKLEKIGIHDNFFDLGGNSLDLVKVNHRLRETIKREIPATSFFLYPNIKELAAYLTGPGPEEQEGVDRSGAIRTGRNRVLKRQQRIRGKNA
jgi:acyl-coenzyme A synthetase/AMP-(fatty) acid ligase/acyl carrier protein